MSLTTLEPESLLGQPAFDAQGVLVGDVQAVYFDTETDAPAWVVLDVGPRGYAFVPLAGANQGASRLDLAVDLELVLSNPHVHPALPDDLVTAEETGLKRHYGLDEQRTPRRRPVSATGSGGRSAAGAKDAVAGAVGDVTSGAAEQAEEVASAAKESGRRVASTATEQGQAVAQATAADVRQVVETARAQSAQVAEVASMEARELLDETRQRLEDQAITQTHRLAQNVGRLGYEARALAEGRPDEAPTARDCSEQAAEWLLGASDRLRAMADDVETRGVQVLLDDLQRFGRRRPATFLLGATVAGFAVGRVIRNTTSSDSGDGADASATRPSEPAAGAGRRRSAPLSPRGRASAAGLAARNGR